MRFSQFLQFFLSEQFDKDASRYHSDVYKRKRNEILNKANSQLHVFFTGQLKNLTKKATTTFNARIQVYVSFVFHIIFKKKEINKC